MILTRLSDYLRLHRRASLRDMSLALGTDSEALRDMLAMLTRKGRVRQLPANTACSSGCTKCQPDTINIFEWTGPQSATEAGRTIIPIRHCTST